MFEDSKEERQRGEHQGGRGQGVMGNGVEYGGVFLSAPGAVFFSSVKGEAGRFISNADEVLGCFLLAR